MTVSGLVLSDGSGLASNYTISNPVGVTGSITPRTTAVSGITAAGKTYDGSAVAQLNAGNAVFSNLVDGEAISLTVSGAFTDKNAGAGKLGPAMGLMTESEAKLRIAATSNLAERPDGRFVRVYGEPA